MKLQTAIIATVLNLNLARPVAVEKKDVPRNNAD
jgi:hypothetical protein